MLCVRVQRGKFVSRYFTSFLVAASCGELYALMMMLQINNTREIKRRLVICCLKINIAHPDGVDAAAQLHRCANQTETKVICCCGNSARNACERKIKDSYFADCGYENKDTSLQDDG